MDRTRELRRILDEYEEEIRQLEKNKRPFDGILGMGRAPSDDPCHEKMDRAVECLLAEAGEDASDALVEALLKAEKESALPGYARLSLIAAQRHCLPLIGQMQPKEKAALCAWYLKAYPRYTRLPVQTELLKALKGK